MSDAHFTGSELEWAARAIQRILKDGADALEAESQTDSDMDAELAKEVNDDSVSVYPFGGDLGHDGGFCFNYENSVFWEADDVNLIGVNSVTKPTSELVTVMRQGAVWIENFLEAYVAYGGRDDIVIQDAAVELTGNNSTE